jgi:hypothetical protein
LHQADSLEKEEMNKDDEDKKKKSPTKSSLEKAMDNGMLSRKTDGSSLADKLAPEGSVDIPASEGEDETTTGTSTSGMGLGVAPSKKPAAAAAAFGISRNNNNIVSNSSNSDSTKNARKEAEEIPLPTPPPLLQVEVPMRKTKEQEQTTTTTTTTKQTLTGDEEAEMMAIEEIIRIEEMARAAVDAMHQKEQSKTTLSESKSNAMRVTTEANMYVEERTTDSTDNEDDLTMRYMALATRQGSQETFEKERNNEDSSVALLPREANPDDQLFTLQVKHGVPDDTIKGAALAAALASALVWNDTMIAAAAIPIASVLSVTRGLAGNVTRTIGDLTWNATNMAMDILKEERESLLRQIIAQIISFGALLFEKGSYWLEELEAKREQERREQRVIDLSEIEKAFFVATTELKNIPTVVNEDIIQDEQENLVLEQTEIETSNVTSQAETAAPVEETNVTPSLEVAADDEVVHSVDVSKAEVTARALLQARLLYEQRAKQRQKEISQQQADATETEMEVAEIPFDGSEIPVTEDLTQTQYPEEMKMEDSIQIGREVTTEEAAASEEKSSKAESLSVQPESLAGDLEQSQPEEVQSRQYELYTEEIERIFMDDKLKSIEQRNVAKEGKKLSYLETLEEASRSQNALLSEQKETAEEKLIAEEEVLRSEQLQQEGNLAEEDLPEQTRTQQDLSQDVDPSQPLQVEKEAQSPEAEDLLLVEQPSATMATDEQPRDESLIEPPAEQAVLTEDADTSLEQDIVALEPETIAEEIEQIRLEVESLRAEEQQHLEEMRQQESLEEPGATMDQETTPENLEQDAVSSEETMRLEADALSVETDSLVEEIQQIRMEVESLRLEQELAQRRAESQASEQQISLEANLQPERLAEEIEQVRMEVEALRLQQEQEQQQPEQELQPQGSVEEVNAPEVSEEPRIKEEGENPMDSPTLPEMVSESNTEPETLREESAVTSEETSVSPEPESVEEQPPPPPRAPLPQTYVIQPNWSGFLD